MMGPRGPGMPPWGPRGPGGFGPPGGPGEWGPPGGFGGPRPGGPGHGGPGTDPRSSEEREPTPAGDSKAEELDLSGEIWVETKAEGGKSYYYNATTRATQWTKPEGEGVKILTQTEVEDLQKKMGSEEKEEEEKNHEASKSLSASQTPEGTPGPEGKQDWGPPGGGAQGGLLEECHRGVGPPGGLVGCPHPGRWALGGPGGLGCHPGVWPPLQGLVTPPSRASGPNTPLLTARGTTTTARPRSRCGRSRRSLRTGRSIRSGCTTRGPR